MSSALALFASAVGGTRSDNFASVNGRSTLPALRGSGGEYAYEVLNFVDGRRNGQEIRDAVAATYGAIPTDYVVEYLKALESIRVIERVR